MNDVCTMETGFGALLTPEEDGKKNELIVKLSKINVRNLDTNVENNYKEHDEGSKIDGTIKKEGYAKDNEDWSSNEISSLLNAWHNCNKNAIECSKLDMDSTWKEISEEVSGQSEKSKKFKDYEQCRQKFKAMQGRYNREKMAKKFNPNEPSSWEWYDTMNTLFNENSGNVNNLMDVKSIKEGVGVIDNTPTSISYYDVGVKDMHVEKRVVEENVSAKLFSKDGRDKLQDVKNEQLFCTKTIEDNNIIQYNNLSTPTTPRSLKTFTKVKWRDSGSSRLNFIDKFTKEEEISQENISNSTHLDSRDEHRMFLPIHKIKEKFLQHGEQNIANSNEHILDKKGKGALKAFDSYSDNSMSNNESDMVDQDSTASSPIVFMASQNNRKVNKHNDKSLIIQKDGDDQHMSRFSVMGLSRSIDCNYNRTCLESVTSSRRSNENKEISNEKVSNVIEENSRIYNNSRRRDDNVATNIGRRNEQMALSIAREDSEAHSAKLLSTESPMASVTPRSESNYSSKQKKRLRVFSRYKYEQENRSTRTFFTDLMHATNNVPRFKKWNRFQARSSHLYEPNIVMALMTFGAMIQQLEKNHIVLMERVLNEQSTILNDFVKTLKYNDQIREVLCI